MVGIPALCLHLQYFEIMTPTQHPSAEVAADNYARTDSRAGKLGSCSVASWRRSNRYPEVSLVPPLMIAVLHRHRGNVQLLLNARADPWQAVPIVSLCDHPGIGLVPVATWICQCLASIRCTGSSGYGGWLTHSKQWCYGSSESRMALELTVRPHCHDRTCYPPLG